MGEPDIERVSHAFDAACRAADVRYAFIGGFAVSVWGRLRGTSDLDAMVVLPPDRVTRFVEALRRQGLETSVADFQDALEEPNHVSVFDPGSIFYVDVKLALTPEEREQVVHAVETEPRPGRRMHVAAAEDTVAFKIAYGSPQDLEDARAILERSGGSMDLTRARAVAERLGVVATFDRLLSETNR